VGAAGHGWFTAVPSLPADPERGLRGLRPAPGPRGIYVEDPDAVGAAWTEALSGLRPSVVVFRTDPAVPPIPPHATWDQIVKAAESVLRGDSDRVDVIKEGVKNKLAELLPDSSH